MNRVINDCTKDFFRNNKEERKAIQKYIAGNPFYTIEEWGEILNHFKDRILSNAELLLIIGCCWVEYENDYYEIKTLYENILDRSVLKEVGYRAEKRGGFERQQQLYYLLKLFSPLSRSNNSLIRQSPHIYVESAWSDIGDWKM